MLFRRQLEEFLLNGGNAVFALSISLSSLERRSPPDPAVTSPPAPEPKRIYQGIGRSVPPENAPYWHRLPEKAVRNESPFFSNFSATFKVAELLLETTATV